MGDLIHLHARCARCGHSYSFHGKSDVKPCRAMGCRAHNGSRCPTFVDTSLSAAS